MTDEQLAPYREELAKVPKFQWVKTDKAGRVAYFKDVVYHNRMVLVEFTDGSRVNYDMLGDAVLKVLDDSMLLDIQNTNAPMENIPIAIGSNASTGPTAVSIGKKSGTASPLHSLLAKQKDNPVPVEISIELNLPPLSLYKVLSESFDNADEEIVEFIVADLDVPRIRAAVKEAIVNFYKSEQ